MTTRCYCGHAVETHQHYRPGYDCGACGVTRCYRYVGRDQEMPWSHAEASAISDAHFWRNLHYLGPYAQSAQIIAAARIPAPRRPAAPVVAWLEQKRAANRKGT